MQNRTSFFKNLSPTILKISGIPIRIHWTFFLFLIWIIFSSENGISDGFSEALFIISIFVCVLLHELGHALTARRFGIGTQDITLYPIGGVALLNREAEPRQEFFIAIAGPLVNVAIAFLVYPLLSTVNGEYSLLYVSEAPLSFYDRLFIVNIVLVIFNMIPAYPMDGGRVVRALLGLFLPHDQATTISARLGQICSLGLGALGLYTGNFILMIISMFIFSMASRELRYIKLKKTYNQFGTFEDHNE